MSLACDSTSPSPWAQTLQEPAPFTGDGFGGGPASLVARVPALLLQAGQLCVLQLHAQGLFFSPFLFPQTWNQYFGSSEGWGGGERKSRGQELATATAALISRQNPSRLIQDKAAAEEILPSQ